MFDIPIQALMGQLLIGLINGSFYALLSLGLAVIFGLLNIINFAHGAQYMLGAFGAYLLLNKLGLSYWWSLLIVPIVVGATGVVIERTMLARLYKLDHLYGLLLTFGLALIIQGIFRNEYGSTGLPYSIPPQLSGGKNLAGPVAVSGFVGMALINRITDGRYRLGPTPPTARAATRYSAINYVSTLAYQAPYFALPVIVLTNVDSVTNGSFYVAWGIVAIAFYVPYAIGQHSL
ncbi:MAG TPA: branched-chain amino acid ABC transporter permease, partial [Ottowia sp.]|nr:branched-chain amino acid ABC transporter permease [Ottowia sp.]